MDVPNLFSVRGKVALVTGGSRGIGEMIAAGLAGAGARVYVASRDEGACAAVASRLTDAGGDAFALPADLATEAGARALAADVAEREERLDILVNNAGATWGAPLEEHPDAALDKVYALNVKAPFHLVRACLPLLRAAADPANPARIVNIGSVDGLRPPRMPTYGYAASKAAIHMLTRQLALELAPEHITVNAVAPGPFQSRMMAYLLDDEATRAQVASQVPLGRIGAPEDMAGAVLFLTSAAGAYLTGVIIPVDGGISAGSGPV